MRGEFENYLTVVGDDGGTEPETDGRSVSFVPEPHTLPKGKVARPISARMPLDGKPAVGT